MKFTKTQAEIVDALQEGLTVSQIAEKINKEPSYVSRTIRKLVDQGRITEQGEVISKKDQKPKKRRLERQNLWWAPYEKLFDLTLEELRDEHERIYQVVQEDSPRGKKLLNEYLHDENSEITQYVAVVQYRIAELRGLENPELVNE